MLYLIHKYSPGSTNSGLSSSWQCVWYVYGALLQQGNIRSFLEALLLFRVRDISDLARSFFCLHIRLYIRICRSFVAVNYFTLSIYQFPDVSC